MKLIDLLVRELHKRGGWPEGFVMAWQSEHDCEVYFCKPDNSTTIAARGLYAGLLNEAADCRGINGSVTRDQYESALAASQKFEWSGDGLPPVGCECEMQDSKGAWLPVVIIAKNDGFTFGWSYDYRIVLFGDKADEFRPIRSESDKRRDAALDAIYGAIASAEREHNRSDEADKVYEAIAAGKIPGVKLEY